jgi:hypothetical protein
MYRSTFFISALVGGKWSDSRPGRFTPGEENLGTNWIGGWVYPRAGLDDGVEEKILISYRDSNSHTSVVPARSQLLYRLIHSNKFQKSFSKRAQLHQMVSYLKLVRTGEGYN